MARRVPILAKLLGAYLGPAVACFVGIIVVAHYAARRTLEAELGRRLTSVAAAAALEISDESVALLAPGDESTRTYRNLQRRLQKLAAGTGAARIYVFGRDRASRCDSDGRAAIGERYYALDAWRAELDEVFGGAPRSSVLFRGRDGNFYKSGFARVSTEFAVGVDGAAALYAQLAGFRQTLVALGVFGALAIAALSFLVARILVEPIRRLGARATAIGAGDLDEPVQATSRDEIGLFAETMEKMRQQLRARDERMQMMLAGIAHEIRNPLGGLELHAGLLREELAKDAEKLSYVQRIEREVFRLATIVNDFLEYARRPRPSLATCELAALLAEVRDIAVGAAAAKNVRVELACEPARVAGDEGQLRRALVNLMHNAVEACPSDGSGTVTLGCARRDGEVLVTVRDTGDGIDEGTLAKIWTPFYTTKQRGTGLGLAFVRDIAEAHGARLAVDTARGRGTTFTLALTALER